MVVFTMLHMSIYYKTMISNYKEILGNKTGNTKRGHIISNQNYGGLYCLTYFTSKNSEYYVTNLIVHREKFYLVYLVFSSFLLISISTKYFKQESLTRVLLKEVTTQKKKNWKWTAMNSLVQYIWEQECPWTWHLLFDTWILFV